MIKFKFSTILPENEEHVNVSHLIAYWEEGYFGFGSRTFSSDLRFQDSLPCACRFSFLTHISWFVSEFSILIPFVLNGLVEWKAQQCASKMVIGRQTWNLSKKITRPNFRAKDFYTLKTRKSWLFSPALKQRKCIIISSLVLFWLKLNKTCKFLYLTVMKKRLHLVCVCLKISTLLVDSVVFSKY